MLAIKFQRIGKKHQPGYRLVVAEKKSKLGGPPVEQIGFYNPATKEATLNNERAKYWLGVGAKPTVTIHNLLIKQGVISGPKIKLKMPAKKVEEAVVSARAATVEAKSPGAAPVVVAEEVKFGVAAAQEVAETVPEAKTETPTESANVSVEEKPAETA